MGSINVSICLLTFNKRLKVLITDLTRLQVSFRIYVPRIQSYRRFPRHCIQHCKKYPDFNGSQWQASCMSRGGAIILKSGLYRDPVGSVHRGRQCSSGPSDLTQKSLRSLRGTQVSRCLRSMLDDGAKYNG